MRDAKVLTVASYVGGGIGMALGMGATALVVTATKSDDGPGPATVASFALPFVGGVVGTYFGLKWALGK